MLESNLYPNLFQFYNNELLTDCLVLNKVSSKEYLAHRIVLAAGSKFFYHMLIPPQVETLTQKDNKLVLEIPDKINSHFSLDDDSVVPILLKYLYSNQNTEAIKSEFTNKNVFQLMALSHSLGVISLTNCLGEYVTKNILTQENCGRIFYESIVYDNETLKNDCLSILKKNFNKISNNLNEFQIILDLPIDIFKQLITSDDLVLTSEKEICDIALNYIKIRKNISKPIAENPEKPAENAEKPAENPEKPEEKALPEKPEEKALPEKPIEAKEKELNFVEKSKKQLEDMRKKMIKSPLSASDERSLVEAIRFSFLTHSDLLSISLDEVMQNHKDLVLEGLSMRLHNYEKNPKAESFKINLKPRKYISK